MHKIPDKVRKACLMALGERGIPPGERGHWLKWIRFYIDFCLKYGYSVRACDSQGPFLAKLESKGQGLDLQTQASEAVKLLLEVMPQFPPLSGQTSARTAPDGGSEAVCGDSPQRNAPVTSSLRNEPPVNQGATDAWTKALDLLENAFATGQYALATRRCYRSWILGFQKFLESLPPEEIDSDHAARYLTFLARERKVTASSQNQAFNALLFFFRKVLEKPFEPKGVLRPRRKKYVPVILTQKEIAAIIDQLEHPHSLVVQLLYGCGLRLTECLSLRVQSLDLDTGTVTIHRGKGEKDRVVPLPRKLHELLGEQLLRCREVYEADLEVEGFAGAFAPERGSAKVWNKRVRQWPWQFLFYQTNLTLVPEEMEMRRYHLHPTKFGGALRKAVKHSGIHKRVTAHTFRHSFASHLLVANYDIKTIQEMMGHSDVRRTMIYVQTVPVTTRKEKRSPLDLTIETGR